LDAETLKKIVHQLLGNWIDRVRLVLPRVPTQFIEPDGWRDSSVPIINRSSFAITHRVESPDSANPDQTSFTQGVARRPCDDDNVASLYLSTVGDSSREVILPSLNVPVSGFESLNY
jgi:hypothetical protein